MSIFTFSCLLLGMSLLSMAVYFVSLYRLIRQPHHAGLVRTAACRVVAAFLYVVIAMSTFAGHQSGLMVTLGVFIVIQLIWQTNAVADVLLTARENKESNVRGDGHTARPATNAKHRLTDPSSTTN